MESQELPEQTRNNGISSAFYILVTVAIGFVVIGPLIGLAVAMLFYEGGIFQLIEQLQNASEYPELRTPLYIMQGIAASIGLILFPMLYIKIFLRKDPFAVFQINSKHHQALLLSAVITIVFMVVNSVFIEWNQNVVFPDFLKGFETWAREREDAAMVLTQMMTSFDSPAQFLFGFLIIAIIPAIGEELVFRGMIQSELQWGSGNMHLAIWLSALLFSAIHMQFFGFVPRMLLGALFGYLYAWSGNLWLPIIAHFTNNGLTIILLYMHQLGHIDMEIESVEAAPWYFVLAFTVITFLLLSYLRKTLSKSETQTHV
jgi:uncharacterized protein